MKTVGVREAKNRLSEVLEEAQTGAVIVTQRGKPHAVLVGVDGRGLEDLAVLGSPRFWRGEFWRLIDERQKEVVGILEDRSAKPRAKTRKRR